MGNTADFQLRVWMNNAKRAIMMQEYPQEQLIKTGQECILRMKEYEEIRILHDYPQINLEKRTEADNLHTILSKKYFALSKKN